MTQLSTDDVRIAVRKAATRLILARKRVNDAALRTEVEAGLHEAAGGSVSQEEIRSLVDRTIGDMVASGEIDTGGGDWILNAPR